MRVALFKRALDRPIRPPNQPQNGVMSMQNREGNSAEEATRPTGARNHKTELCMRSMFPSPGSSCYGGTEGGNGQKGQTAYHPLHFWLCALFRLEFNPPEGSRS